MKSPGYVISHKIQIAFRELGLLVYRYPGPFFWTPIIITLLSTVGLLRFYEENRIWFLYSPSNAPSHFEHAVAQDFFEDRGGKFWVELPVTARDTGNLLRDGYLEEVEEVSNFLQYNLTVPCTLTSSGNCSFRDFCYGACNDNQVVPIFRLIYRNESQRLHPNFRLTYPTMHIYNDEYYVGENFAGVSINKNTNRISDIRVIVLYFRTDRQNDVINEVIERWESRLLSYANSFQHPFINISCSSDGMFSSEVRRNGMSCVPYFGLTVVMVFSFIFLTSRDRRDETFSSKDGLLVALFGTLGPLMAIVTMFNLMFLCGVQFNSITLVAPFLIIGVGCDDVFIIVHAWRKTNRSDGLEQRIARTMEEAGPSITVTSLTNGLSFGVGALTNTPAIHLFCLYAAVGVLIDYVYQITFFAAATVYEGMRLTDAVEGKSKIAMEMQKIEEAHHLPGSHNGIVSKYCRKLKTWQSRVIVLGVLLVYWSASIYGCREMQVKMDSTNLILDDSPLVNVAWIYERYLWRQGSLVFAFVNNPPDLSREVNQAGILDMVNRFETLEYSMGRNSTSLWLRPFLSQALLFQNERTRGFYQILEAWLKDAENGGGRWNDMIRLRRVNGTVVGVNKFMFATASTMGERASWALRAQLQEQWRQLADQYPQYNVTIFQPYSFYVDLSNSIRPTTAGTVGVAMITMAVACLLMIPSASSILSSSLAMISINIGVFGGLSLWGVNLDPLAMCTTLMAIGFSVDFTAHISYHYYRCPRTWSSDVRLADALRSIGWPMIQAGVSTVLSVSPLLLVDSYMIYVFVKTIVLVIALGLLHGIVFLPVLLLTIGASTISEKVAVHAKPSLCEVKADSSVGVVKAKLERVKSVSPQGALSNTVDAQLESQRRLEASRSL